jgi:hypothetical protein
VHPHLRSVIEAAEARAWCAARIAFAMLCLFANEFRATLARAIAYGAAVAAFALVALEVATIARGTGAAQTRAQEWSEVGRPMPAFAMTMPEFDTAPHYSIWRHQNGGGRKDILAFGEPNAGGATAMVEIYRPASEFSQPDEAEDITASIAQLRLSGPRVAPHTIDTKFGQVLVEQFIDRAPGGERRCLRFTRSFEEPRLDISGWYCNAGLELVDRGMIACALDHLTLTAGGSEPKLTALFARAELKRSFCGTNSVFVAATPKRASWIEAARDPRLRGRQ